MSWRRLTPAFLSLLLLFGVLHFSYSAASSKKLSIDFALFHQKMSGKYGDTRVELSQQWERMLLGLADLDELEKLKRVNQFFQNNVRFKSDQA